MGNNIPRCTSAREVERICNNKNNRGKVNVSYKTRHYWFEGTDQNTGQKTGMAVPCEIKGNGTWFSIVKFLLKIGVIFCILYAIWYFYPILETL